jgi:lipopolysaccharide transport system permease protein
MAAQIFAIGIVFGLIFKTPIQEFLPFLAVSLITWTFISGSIVDGSLAYVNSEAQIKQLRIQHYVFAIRSIWKNALMFCHHLVIIPVVFLIFFRAPNLAMLLALLGVLLTIAFLLSVTVVLAFINARYRDVQQILSSGMMMVFYITPVIWQPNLIPSGVAHLLLGLNPFYHFLQVIRLPLLGQTPTLENWLVSTFVTIGAAVIAYFVSKKLKDRLAYWV